MFSLVVRFLSKYFLTSEKNKFGMVDKQYSQLIHTKLLVLKLRPGAISRKLLVRTGC